MARVFDHMLCTGAFVERRIIPDDHWMRRKLRDQVLLKPEIKDVSVDITIRQANSWQRAHQ